MTLASHWTEIANALGLEIQSPVEVALSDGTTLHAPVLLKNFGAEKGMILFEGIRDDIFELNEVLVSLGYGFSCLSSYRENEPVDLEGAKEVLADWEWSGPPNQRPAWLADPPQDEDDN
ncbi:MAG: hypothetical protein JO056_01135 [Alphaproteobacteria bacterium]|nr:hypothetical protein [Alphaproteobacteria bacterium]